MGELSPLHYRIAETPLFSDEPRRVVRGGAVYEVVPAEHLDPRIAADEAVNRIKTGLDKDDQRRVVETHIRPIIEAEFGLSSDE